MIDSTGNMGGGGIVIRTGTLPRPCPWCYRAELTFEARPRSLRVTCEKKCGYVSTLRHSDLSKDEKAVAYPGSVDNGVDNALDEC